MKISFFNLDENDRKKINSKFSDYNLNFFLKSVNKTDIKEYRNSNIICICPKSKIDKNIIDSLPELKYIITRSTGIDHIDYEYCLKKNIQVINVVKYGGASVAEYQFALLLSLSRKLELAHKMVKNGDFSKNNLEGIDLYGKTIGIIGCGNIGQNVLRLSCAFGMNVLIYTRRENKELSDMYKFKYVTLDELYEKSDFISINIPLNKETHHFINKNSFDKMKKNVILINTSRGSIIDSDALIDALENNKLFAVGLDVIEGEKIIKGDFLDVKKQEIEKFKNNLEKLLKFENVIITPHNAYNTVEAKERIIDETISIIDNILSQ